MDHLRVSIASSSTRVKELERQQRNFSALVKKQEKLITILNEQKVKNFFPLDISLDMFDVTVVGSSVGIRQ